ncbi:hypothetical protein H7I53_18115 [Mycolicibacterium pulveris]|uniref:Uncharacterized protein n=1 Tax=Mycolicibacterium pulveris TaxID=36813 RepID=A0A7I7UCD6_MYCPV|nr:hypothetical protein [Mycolicibacterium pulveris]MCV6982131.1 hypothetical protein [Mycolicibacterium pulveris]BBY78915.1 hypothetical protein MPUL_00730 [Mycolicibacterium pulveris]
MSAEYIVITPQIEGSPECGYAIRYYSDHRRYASLTQAVRHGTVDLDRCDDFLIGNVQGRRLTAVQWMNECRDDERERREIADQLGLDE